MKSILAIFLMCLIIVAVCTGCVHSQQAGFQPEPPFNSVVVVAEDGNSAAAMIMTKYDNSISNADMEKVRADVLSKLPNQTPKPGQLQATAVLSTNNSTGTARLVVYGYAVNPEGIPVSYMGTAGNAQYPSSASTYQGGVDWLFDHMKNSPYYVVTR
jgi:hypothetical protein